MELKEFITSTLIQIQEGVQEAIKITQDKGLNGVINPIWGTINDNSAHRQNIQFDVAVTVADKNNGSAQAGVKGSIKIVEFSLGGSGEKTVEKSNVNRIQFTIPIIPPAQLVKAN